MKLQFFILEMLDADDREMLAYALLPSRIYNRIYKPELIFGQIYYKNPELLDYSNAELITGSYTTNADFARDMRKNAAVPAAYKRNIKRIVKSERLDKGDPCSYRSIVFIESPVGSPAVVALAVINEASDSRERTLAYVLE